MKPMLATDYDPKLLRYPCIASPKLDGVRGLIHDGKLLSRSLKPIPNKYTQRLFGWSENNGLDGELIVGDPTDPHCYTNTVSHVMAHDKCDFDITYYVFDLHYMDKPYTARRTWLEKLVYELKDVRIKVLEQRVINNEQELLDYELEKLAEGYEGLILRDPNSLYKYGRSTAREGILLKVKRFSDGEATIIGYEEQLKNNNPKTTNELGRSKRSSHQDNKVGKGTLGALHVRDVKTGVEFHIGTGMNDELRDYIWEHQEGHLGMLVKYKHFIVGSVDKPRHPVFLGFRAKEDM